jgi:hypothetical protein
VHYGFCQGPKLKWCVLAGAAAGAAIGVAMNDRRSKEGFGCPMCNQKTFVDEEETMKGRVWRIAKPILIAEAEGPFSDPRVRKGLKVAGKGIAHGFKAAFSH